MALCPSRSRRLCTCLLSLVVGWLAAATQVSAADEELTVTGDRVNLRAGPGVKFETVGQVSSGSVLVGGGREGEWVRVDVPNHVDLWVYGELVKDAVVAVDRLRARGGPGINYRAVGRLDKGFKVKVRGRKGEWLKIAPPPGCELWIHGDYVRSASAPPSQKPRPAAPEPAPTVVRRPSAPVAPRAQVAPAPRPVPQRKVRPEPVTPKSAAETSSRLTPGRPQHLVASKPQGRRIKVSGVLGRTGWGWRRPSSYHLVCEGPGVRDEDRFYVLGDEAVLDGWEGRRVRIEGRRYWVQGVRYPVLAPESIEAAR